MSVCIQVCCHLLAIKRALAYGRQGRASLFVENFEARVATKVSSILLFPSLELNVAVTTTSIWKIRGRAIPPMQIVNVNPASYRGQGRLSCA